MLVKNRGQPTYLLSKNLQVRLWHRRLSHAFNARIVEVFKLNDKVDIIVEDDQIVICFFFDSEPDEDDNSEEPNTITPLADLNKIIDPTDDIKDL